MTVRLVRIRASSAWVMLRRAMAARSDLVLVPRLGCVRQLPRSSRRQRGDPERYPSPYRAPGGDSPARHLALTHDSSRVRALPAQAWAGLGAPRTRAMLV